MRPLALARRLPSVFTLLDRLFRLRDGARWRRPSTRLGLAPLEDRLVPTAVGPGGYWDDGQWVNGYKTGVTVTLRNFGPGWLEVTGGGGAVSVSPGSEPTYGGSGSGSGSGYTSGYESLPGAGSGSGSGSPSGGASGAGSGSGSGSGTGSAVYSFEVWGSVGDGSGDVTWSGAADNLYVKATGDVGPIGIGGDLYVDAGWTVGNLSGRDVSARAGKSIGTVDASDDVGGLTAGTSIGAVTAADDVAEVRAGTSVGAVAAGGDVGTVSAGRSTASVQAGGHILTVSAGWDVGGAVTAGTFIGGYDNPTNDWYVWQYATFGGGVSAGRNVVGSVRAGASLSAVRAGGEIQAEVRAGGDIWVVTAGGGSDPAAGPGSGMGSGSGSGSGAAQLTGRIAGPVVAGRDVHFVSSTGDVVGAVTAGRSATAVNAGGSVLGPVTAALDVGRRGAADTEPTWRPAYYDPYWYGWSGAAPLGAGVQARDGSVGAVTATAGDVTVVSAGGTVGGAVTAGRDIGSVTGRTGVSGAVAGERDVGSVRAGMGSGSGSGEPADVSGKVQAGRDIGSVSATGDVTGRVQAGHGIGGVTAGGDITSTITAGAAVGRTDDADPRIARYHPYLSDYGNPYWGAGVRAGGDFTGEVTAGTDVSRVEAGGSLGGSVHADRDVGFVHGTGGVSAGITAGRDVGWVYAGAYAPGYYGGWQEVAGAAPADFTGSIAAGGGVATVAATRKLEGTVTAGDSIGYLGDLVADGGEGPYPGEVGNESLFWGIGLSAGEDLVATVDAGGDVAGIRAGRDIGGSIHAGRDVSAFSAPRTVSAAVMAGRDIRGVDAGVDVLGGLTAVRNIGSVTARSLLGGRITGGVAAGGDIGPITATSFSEEAWPVELPGVEPSATDADYLGRPLLDAGGLLSGLVWAGGSLGRVTVFGSITADLLFNGSGTVVWAAEDITGDIDSGTASVDVASWGVVGGGVTAAGDAKVRAYGGIAGGVRSLAGAASLRSWGDATGSVRAAREVRLFAAGDVGRDGASLVSETGPVTVGAQGSVTAGLQAAGDVRLQAGGRVRGSLTSTSGNVTLAAGGNVLAPQVTAPQDVTAYTEGAFLGAIEAGGNATLIAVGGVTGSAAAGRNAAVFSAGDVTGSVTARGGNAFAQAARFSGSVEATGWAEVQATSDVLGTVSGPGRARVTAFGGVSADVRSQHGPVSVEAAGAVTGPVSGAGDVEVRSRQGITSSVTSVGGDVSLLAFQDLTGSATAYGSLTAYSGGDSGASLTTTHGPVSVTVVGNFTGTVAAGADVNLTVGGNITGAITAGVSPGTGWVSANVTGIVMGSVTGQVSASGVVALGTDPSPSATPVGPPISSPPSPGDDASAYGGGQEDAPWLVDRIHTLLSEFTDLTDLVFGNADPETEASDPEGDEEYEYVFFTSDPAPPPATGASAATGWRDPASPFYARDEDQAKYRAWVRVAPTGVYTQVGPDIAQAFGIPAGTTWEVFYPTHLQARMEVTPRLQAERMEFSLLARLNADWTAAGQAGAPGPADAIGAQVAARWRYLRGYEWVRAETGWQELYPATMRAVYQQRSVAPIPVLPTTAGTREISLSVPPRDFYQTFDGVHVSLFLTKEFEDRILPRLMYATPGEIAAYIGARTANERVALGYALSDLMAQLANIQVGWKVQIASLPTNDQERAADLLRLMAQAQEQLAGCQVIYSELNHNGDRSKYGVFATDPVGIDGVLQASQASPANPLGAIDLSRFNRGTLDQRVAFLADLDYPTFLLLEGLSPDVTKKAWQRVDNCPDPGQFYRYRNQVIHAVRAVLAQPGKQTVTAADFAAYFGRGGQQYLFDRYIRGADPAVGKADYYLLDRYNAANMAVPYLAQWGAAGEQTRAAFADRLQPLDRAVLVTNLIRTRDRLALAGNAQGAVEAQAMAVEIQRRHADDLARTNADPALRAIYDQARVAARIQNGEPQGFARLPLSVRILSGYEATDDFRAWRAQNPVIVRYDPATGFQFLDRTILNAAELLAPVYRTAERAVGAAQWAVTGDVGRVDYMSRLDEIRRVMSGDFTAEVGPSRVEYGVFQTTWDGFLTVLTVLPIGSGSRTMIAGGQFVAPTRLLAGRQWDSAARHMSVFLGATVTSSGAMAAVEVSPIAEKYKGPLRLVAGLTTGLGAGVALADRLPRINSVVVENGLALHEATTTLASLERGASALRTAQRPISLAMEVEIQYWTRVVVGLRTDQENLTTLGGPALIAAEAAHREALQKVARLEGMMAPGQAPSMYTPIRAQLRQASAELREAEGRLAAVYARVEAEAQAQGFRLSGLSRTAGGGARVWQQASDRARQIAAGLREGDNAIPGLKDLRQGQALRINRVLTDEEMMALSETTPSVGGGGGRGAEWSMTVLPDNKAVIMYGSRDGVGDFISANAIEYVHNHPGDRALVPSLDDLVSQVSEEYLRKPMRIISRADGDRTVSATFTFEECQNLRRLEEARRAANLRYRQLQSSEPDGSDAVLAAGDAENAANRAWHEALYQVYLRQTIPIPVEDMPGMVQTYLRLIRSRVQQP